MLQELKEEIALALARIEARQTEHFTVLGEEIASSKKAGNWKEPFADRFSAVNEIKASLKTKNRTIARWGEIEKRRNEIRFELQELAGDDDRLRVELEESFEAIGAAAFELYQNEPSSFNDTAELLKDMHDLEAGIKEKERELRQLETDGRPDSLFKKTLRKGKGMVIRGSLKTRELQRGKRLKLVGEHVCERIPLAELPNDSALAKQLAYIQSPVSEWREIRGRIDVLKQESSDIESERIAIEKEARMRNPARNMAHDVRRLETELAEVYTLLGREFYTSVKHGGFGDRAAETISSIKQADDDLEEHLKLLSRVEAAQAIGELESRRESLEDEQQKIQTRIEEVETAIGQKLKERGNPATLKLPAERPLPTGEPETEEKPKAESGPRAANKPKADSSPRAGGKPQKESKAKAGSGPKSGDRAKPGSKPKAESKPKTESQPKAVNKPKTVKTQAKSSKTRQKS